MDRFKFRIWDIKQQKYRQRTHHEADTCINCLSGKVLFGEGIEIYGEEDDKDVILEQCTGLKDKNGKLIYEGDIISNKEYLHEIVWNKDDASFHTILKGMRPIVCGHIEQIWIDEFEYEVIGNIHENADLLGEDE